MLTIKLGQRDDLSPDQLKDLLSGSIDVIRRRLFTVVKPERQAGDQAGDERDHRRH